MERSSNHYTKLVIGLLAAAALALGQTNAYYNNQTPPQQRVPPGSAPQADYARPGTLNYVEGQVSANGQPLTVQAVGHFALQAGQALQTSAGGYAEVLLTPGAFLRVGPNSDFTMTSVGLADTRIKLNRGNALIEADQIIPGSHVEVTLDTTSVDVLKKGLYGFSANPPDVKTFEGQAEVVGQTKSEKIGKHDQILLAGNESLKKSNFDENQAKQDPLYVWSEARSRTESAQNKLVAQNAAGYVPAGDGWFWDPYVGYYGFWGPGSFYSPFGFGFYGGFYPGFYGGFYGGYHRGFFGRGAGYRGFAGFHGNGVGFHAGGFHGGGFGGFHGGGGRR